MKYSTGMETKERPSHPTTWMNFIIKRMGMGKSDTKMYILCNLIDIKFYKIVKTNLQC